MLIEVHDRHELERAYKVNAKIDYVNNRDFKTICHKCEIYKYYFRKLKLNQYYMFSEVAFTMIWCKKIYSGIDGLLIGEALMLSDNLSEFLPQLKMQKVKSWWNWNFALTSIKDVTAASQLPIDAIAHPLWKSASTITQIKKLASAVPNHDTIKYVINPDLTTIEHVLSNTSINT